MSDNVEQFRASLVYILRDLIDQDPNTIQLLFELNHALEVSEDFYSLQPAHLLGAEVLAEEPESLILLSRRTLEALIEERAASGSLSASSEFSKRS